jgi:hypothetical protein
MVEHSRVVLKLKAKDEISNVNSPTHESRNDALCLFFWIATACQRQTSQLYVESVV